MNNIESTIMSSNVSIFSSRTSPIVRSINVKHITIKNTVYIWLTRCMANVLFDLYESIRVIIAKGMIRKKQYEKGDLFITLNIGSTGFNFWFS